jgi:hypothetical protein
MNRILVALLICVFGAGCTPMRAKTLGTRTVKSSDTGSASGLDAAQIAALTPQNVVVSVEEEAPSATNPSSPGWNSTPSKTEVDPTTILGTIAGLVINPADKDLWSLVGQQAWTIVDKNKPVLNYRDKSVSVLPNGYKNWQEMEQWNARAITYRLTIKNLYGATVVDQAYTIKFFYGGRLNGNGRYLANVSVAPKISVVIGYKLDSAVEFSRVVNAGTRENPIPALEMRIGWNVKTILKEARESDSFFIKGDGSITHLQ